jgi:hypothetical protein
MLALAVAMLAGCGGDSTNETTTSAGASTVRVYFLRGGKVWPVAREVDEANVASALDALMAGPTKQERTELGITTAVPREDADYRGAGLAQLVYTMTQFPMAHAVEVDGKTYTRVDFEDQTPAILVESPLPFTDVSSPLRATGTANTFEATFNYELTDSDGRIVDENFVTATSGTGTRGTFDFTTKPFTVPFEGVGSLVVFERSAEDGSRTKLVEIPLRMSQ